jgi:integral membrane protein
MQDSSKESNRLWINSAAGRMRIIAHAEGTSYLLLLGIAVPLKYIWHMPEFVKIMGMIHGVLFIAYCILLVERALRCKWTFLEFCFAGLASLIPFGTWWADNKLFYKAWVENNSKEGYNR